MQKKQKILLTMLELVVKKGVHATPMSLVARESSVSIGTIYHHFKSKQEILNEIYVMIKKDFATILTHDIENKSDEEVFKTYWNNLYHYYISNPLAFEFFEFIARPPIISQKLISETKIYYTEHTKFFKNGTENGTLKNMETPLMVQIAVNTVVASVNLKLNNSLEMNTKQIKSAVNSAWDAIRNTKN